MEAYDSILLLGDLSDSWVGSIGDGLPARFRVTRVDCPDDLPERAWGPGRPPLMVVAHRNRLTAGDARRIAGWRGPAGARGAPLVVLCTSPYVRYDDLDRWRGIADLVLPEATARDVLAARFARLAGWRRPVRTRPDGNSLGIEVSGSLEAVSLVVMAACARAGYRSRQVGDLLLERDHGGRPAPPPASERVLTIWDVPVLEPGWADQLERRARLTGPVIALMGFADRASVALARAHGAEACLELPFEIDDLLFLIDRAFETRPLETWPLPARFEPPHVLPPRSRRPRSRPDASPAGPPWPDHDREPTIP